MAARCFPLGAWLVAGSLFGAAPLLSVSSPVRTCDPPGKVYTCAVNGAVIFRDDPCRADEERRDVVGGKPRCVLHDPKLYGEGKGVLAVSSGSALGLKGVASGEGAQAPEAPKPTRGLKGADAARAAQERARKGRK